MAIVIRPDSRKNMALLTGRIDARVMELSREMPGRRKWQGRDLAFEATRANIEFIREKLPDAVWEIDRAKVIERLEQLEADARAAKDRPLPPEAAHFRYKTKPRDHQAKAFLLSRDRVSYGLWLEQGLGKTKIILDTAAHLWANGKIEALLIDAPNGVHMQWLEEQFPIHFPDFVPYEGIVYYSEQTQRWKRRAEEVFDVRDKLKVFCIHHDAFVTEKGLAFARRVLSSFKTLWAIDESSRKIKNPGAKRSKETMKLRDLAAFRRVLDGTPVTRGIEDLYLPLKFLGDDVHGHSSFYTYRNRYCITAPVPGAPTGVVKIVGYQNVEELQKRMDGWSLRLRAADCLDLPPRIYSTRYVTMTAEQKRLYSELKEDFLTQLKSGEVITVDQALVKILRLQQILCGHVKDENGVVHAVPQNRVDEALAAAEESGDKCIVWARFHHDIDSLSEAFRKAGRNPVTWDGRTSPEGRRDAKMRFIEDPDCTDFIANPGSAGTGTDGLQHASHTMIYYSNTFKASERWQGEARLFRDGQKGTVNVIDLVVPGTVDVKILTALKNRQDIASLALDIRNWV